MSKEKQKKEKVHWIVPWVISFFVLFILSALLSMMDSRFQPLVWIVWIGYFGLVAFISLRTTMRVQKPRFCSKCGVRTKIDWMEHYRSSVMVKTLKTKCPKCGHVDDTGNDFGHRRHQY